jgi:2-keto-4-pentenoate hydratase
MDPAELLLKAHTGRAQLPSSGAVAPADVAAVYEVQDRVYARLSGSTRPAAWKVGTSSPDVEPTISPILPGRLFDSPARVSASEFHIIGIEAEIAFRVVRGGFEAVVAIELCDARLSDWKTASPLWKLADNQMNWGLVAGSGTRNWQAIDFTAQPCELIIGGEKRVAGKGLHAVGNPFRLMVWTEAHLASRIGGLREGDIVTTGSWGGMHFAGAGDEVVARFPGIGEAAARIS